MGPKKNGARVTRKVALALAKAQNPQKNPDGRRAAAGQSLLEEAQKAKANDLAAADAKKVKATELANRRVAKENADERRALALRIATLEQSLATRMDQDTIQGIDKDDLLPLDPHVPQLMSAGEMEARKELETMRDQAQTMSTAFLASEERVSALEAKATKKASKSSKSATQTKDDLLSESEEEGSSEGSDSDEDDLEPPKKAAKSGMLSDVMIRKIMKVNLSRDWTGDVNKATLKFNKSIFNNI
jgi:hypothetical protein